MHAIPHQSFLTIGSEVPIVKKSSFPPGEAKGVVRIRPRFHKTITAYRKTPLRLAKSRLAAAQLCIKRLYAVEDGYTR